MTRLGPVETDLWELLKDHGNGVYGSTEPCPIPCQNCRLLRHNHFEAFPVNVEDLDAFIGFEVTTQLCDVNVHGTSVEIVRVAPNRFQGIGALKQIVAVLAQAGRAARFPWS